MAALSRRPGRRALLLGAAGLLAVWLVAPRAAPPLYDGIAVPADPYRYLAAPPGITSRPPDPISQPVPLVAGKSPPIAVATDENPPQAQILIQGDSFDLPAGATAVTATITAVPPPPAAPPDGALDGNVYRFAVAAGGGPLALRAGSIATVVLRGPAGAGDAVVEQVAGGGWHRLDTQAVGNPDTWEANITALGDFALVAAPGPGVGGSGGGGGAGAGGGSQGAAGGGTSGGLIAGIVGGAVVLLVAAALIAVRLTRRPPPTRRR